LLLLHDSVLCFVFLHLLVFLFMIRLPPISTLFPYTTLFRSSPSGCHFKFCGQPIRSLSSGKCFIQLLSFRKFNPIEGFLAFKRRSEEHTSELQSRFDLVCRLLLEKKKKCTN